MEMETKLAPAGSPPRKPLEFTHEEPVAPRDDQFIYTKEIVKERNLKTGTTKTYVDENWRSVDDSQRSWVMEVGKGWWADPPKANESIWPTQDWTRLEKLPTEPAAISLTALPRWRASMATMMA